MKRKRKRETVRFGYLACKRVFVGATREFVKLQLAQMALKALGEREIVGNY